MRLSQEKTYSTLFKLFVESLEKIVGKGIRALCYASGKEVGRKLANGVKVRKISDAFMLIYELFNGKMIIRKNNDMLVIDQSPIFDLKDTMGNVVPGLAFFNDGLIAGLLESLLDTRLEVVPTYKSEIGESISMRKLLYYKEDKKIASYYSKH